MTYNVFSGTLNPTQSINQSAVLQRLWSLWHSGAIQIRLLLLLVWFV